VHANTVMIPLKQSNFLIQSYKFGIPSKIGHASGVLNAQGDASGGFVLAPGYLTQWVGRSCDFVAVTHDITGLVSQSSCIATVKITP